MLSAGRVVGRRSLSTGAGKSVAVVLSGCGVFDGSEATEAVSCLVALSRNGASIQCFAPDKPQMHAIDHTSGSEHEDPRNAMKESARIARGNVKPLSELSSGDYDAVVFPGGFGAAKNLSSWAVDGAACTVDDDVRRVIEDFHAARKCIGACCIAPVLLAKVIPGSRLTVGMPEGDEWPYAGTVQQVKDLGADHVDMGLSSVCVDETLNLVTAPAFMKEAPFHEVFDNVNMMVDEVVKRAG